MDFYSTLPVITSKLTLEQRAEKHFFTDCCKDNCKQQFSFEQCLRAHKWYHGQSQLDSRKWLAATISSSIDSSTHVQLHFEQKPVCHTAFKLLYDMSNNKFVTATNDTKHSFSIISHKNTGLK